MISGLSHCAGVVLTEKQVARLKHIEFVPLEPGKGLVVLVGEDQNVENRIINLPPGLPPSVLQEASNYLNTHIRGLTLAAGGAYLSIGYVGSFTENMTGGRGFIALAALIFGNWRPFRAVAAAMLFGFSTALAFRLPAYADSLPGIEVLVQALPYVLTLVAVAGVIGRSIPPAAVGRPYKKQ